MLPRFVGEVFGRSVGKKRPDAVELSMCVVSDERLFDLLDPGDPTLAETMHEAALAVDSRAIHSA
jgi:hypothetical protein